MEWECNEYPIIPSVPKKKPSLWERLVSLFLRSSPQVIDAEFRVLDNPSVDYYGWELTPDEERQIRKWKGLE